MEYLRVFFFMDFDYRCYKKYSKWFYESTILLISFQKSFGTYAHKILLWIIKCYFWLLSRESFKRVLCDFYFHYVSYFSENMHRLQKETYLGIKIIMYRIGQLSYLIVYTSCIVIVKGFFNISVLTITDTLILYCFYIYSLKPIYSLSLLGLN